MGSEARAAARNGRKKSLETGGPNSGGSKLKKSTGGTPGVTDFFTPVSKRCKVAAEIAEHEKIEGNMLHEAPKDEDDFQDPGNSKEEPEVPNPAAKEETNDDFQESSVLATIFKREPKKKKKKKQKIQIDVPASMAELPSVLLPALMVPFDNKTSGKGKEKKEINTILPQPEEPDLSQPTVLAAIFDRKPGKKKYKKDKEGETAAPQPEEPIMSQPACSTEQKLSVGSPANGKQFKASPAKKKLRKQPSSGVESKPIVGVHGPDLRTQARQAAEENARMSAGKATHPFFARQKVGGAKALVMDEVSQLSEGQNLLHVPDTPELQEALGMSMLKAPHLFSARQKLGGSKAPAVDETLHNFETASLQPCPPLHVTQNVEVMEQNLVWDSRWTLSSVIGRAKSGEEEGANWPFSSSPPLFTWTWPLQQGANKGSHPVSQKVALQQLVAYLKTPDGKVSSSFFSGEDVQFEEGLVEKLLERLSSYYFSHAKGVHFENDFVLQPEEVQEKDANGSQNLLWTDQYQPQNSREVCGNRDTVNFLNTWLQEWRERILLHRGVAKKTEESGDDDDDYDSDFEDSLPEDDNEDLQNCLLVTGPVGCGKSAAIYACATEQGFTVIEVNASDCRNGALIKHKFKEAMESHGLSNRSSGMVASDIQTASPEGKANLEHSVKKADLCPRNIFQDEDSQTQLAFSQGTSRGYVPPPSLRRLRVILFEDVDTVFEEDAGFMGALALLARTSKCPIIFTSNNPQPVLPQVRQLQSIEFQQLSIKELVEHAYMICVAEGVPCRPGLLEDIVKANGYDLRKLLLLLQFWSQGLPVDTHRLEGASKLPVSHVMSHTVSEEPVILEHSQETDLLHCLMQLDGCPQVPVGEELGLDHKISISHCGSSHGCLVASSDQSASGCSGKFTGKSLKIDVDGGKREENGTKFERQLDTDWLFECDSQHRVLPCLFPTNKPCLLTHSVFEHLKAVGQRADDSVDVVAATWSRYRIDDLQAKADAASQARKAAKKLQAAARKEAIAMLSHLDNGTIDCGHVSLLDALRSDGAVMNTLSADGQSMDFPGNGAFLDPSPDGNPEEMELRRGDLADVYSKVCETSRSDALISGPLLTVDLRTNLTDLNAAADRVSQAISQGGEVRTLLPIRACEISGPDAPSVLLDFMDEQYIQYPNDRTGFNFSKTWLAEGSESSHSLSSGYPLFHDQDQQDLVKLVPVDMNLQGTAPDFGQGEVDFSFTKLMESSYNSLAVQTAMQDCNDYSLSLLQGHEHYSAHLSESSRASVQEAYPPGPELTIEQMNIEYGTHSLPKFEEGPSPKLLSHFQTAPYEGPKPVCKQNTQKQSPWVLNRNPHTSSVDIGFEEQLMTRMFTDHTGTTVRGTETSLDGDRPVSAMGFSPSSQEVEWTLHRRDLGPDFDFDMGLSVLTGPVSEFVQQTLNLSTELHDNSNLSPKISSQNSCLDQQVRLPAEKVECLSTPLHTSKRILPDSTATPAKEGPISASLVAITNLRLHTMGSEIVDKGWQALRESEELPSISHDVGETVLVEGILCDLSACDILSSLSDAENQISMRRRAGDQDLFCSSAEACKSVAAMLAQMQLSQALVPPDIWPSLGCRVGPSVTQHEPSRQETQARLDQSVEDILPQRCRMLGSLGKVEYNAFYSKLARLESIKHDNLRAGMTRRQRRLT